MTHGHRHITNMLLALLLTIGVAITACTSPDEPAPTPDPAGSEPQTRIGLYLNLPVLTDGSTSTSRSLTSRTPTDGPYGPESYDPGYGYENYIDLEGKDYRIYVFVPDDVNKGQDILYTEVSSDSVDIVSWNFTQFSRIYGLSFPVDKNFHDCFNGQNLKLVVLANWHGVYPTDLHPMVPYAGGSTTGNTSGSTSTGSDSSSASGSETSCTTLTELLSYTEGAAGFMNCKIGSASGSSTGSTDGSSSAGTSSAVIGSTDIAGNSYSPFPAAGSLSTETRIPLFGVTEFQTVNILTNLLTWLGNVDLLRAVAKIDVYDAHGSAEITSVQLTRYNTALAKAPAGITSHGDYVHGSYNPDYANTPTIPGSATTSGSPDAYEWADPICLTKVDNPDSPDHNHFIIYVPEYRNIESKNVLTGTPRSENQRARLEIKYKDGVTFKEEDGIDFKYYTDPPANSGYEKGSHFNILRNYWYKFEINRNKSSIIPIVDVVPYGEVKLDPSFGLDTD